MFYAFFYNYEIKTDALCRKTGAINLIWLLKPKK